jgi:Putative peptidoglycan binding domain
MHTKSLLCLVCFLAVTFAVSTVDGGPHRRSGNRFASRPTRAGVGRTFVGGNRFVSGNRFAGWNGRHWSGQHFAGNHWNGGHWNNHWNWHHHNHFRDFVFIDVGFPFWGWGYPYYYDPYPYGYYGGGYYGSGSYGYNSGNGYAYENGSGYSNGSNVAELQRKLADAGYYRGPIDGIMGSRTYYALKAYRHDHNNGNNVNGGYSPTLRDRPYSPPPVTTETESTE